MFHLNDDTREKLVFENPHPSAIELQTEFAVGTKPHQFKAFIIGLAVNQHQIGAKVAIPVIAPFADQRMIKIAQRQWLIVREEVHRVH